MREAGISTKKVQPKKPSGSELALAYLTSWSEKPEEWKFQKTRQTWLLLHMYDKEKVPDKYFTILLDYLQGLQGSARDITVQKAEAFMKEFDGSNAEDPDLLEKCDVFIQKRLTTSMPCSDTVTGMEFSAAVSRLAAVLSLSVLLLMVRQQLRGCSCTAGRWLAGGCGGCTQCQSPSEAQRYIKLIFQCKKLVKRVCNKEQYY
uniref:Chromosome 7 open reading frame 50 n=1 Tax=Falco tinnunculus TaxID=100819 RepID=A0A8C4TZC3_FALTI